MTAKKSKSTKARTIKQLGLRRKTIKDLTAGGEVRGGRRGVNTDSCIIRVTCNVP
jgi:hypothetical protein